MRRSSDSPLRESNLKLRLALRAAQIGTWDWNVASGRMQYSPRARAICGFSPHEEVDYDKARAVTHPDDLPRTSAQAMRALDPALRARDPYEYRIVRADTGEQRWVLAYGEAIFARGTGGQKAVRYLGTIQDITERKATEEALRHSELRQRLAMEAAKMAIWELDTVNDTAVITPELCSMFGLDPASKPTLQDLRQRYAASEREKVHAAGLAALERGETRYECEFRVRWPDGSPHWLLMRAEILYGASNRPERVIGVILDIDGRKRQEEQERLFLRELNHRVKNSLSVVQSIANQTFRDGRADPQALDAFRQRLHALASANDLLVARDWAAFSLGDLVEALVAPYRDPPGRIALSGDEVSLPPRLNASLALVVHELATNAARHGALANGQGHVVIDWRRAPHGVELSWTETGGDALAMPPNKGFGLRLISDILADELGAVELEALPDGLRCRILIAV